MAGELDEYTWIFGFSIVFALGAAIGIGSNDLANSFGTVASSRALKMWQIVILAGICEFLGAVLLGAGVTSTVKSGIIDVNKFQDIPQVLMYGFMCVIITGAFWDNMASYLGMPVSTTHTTVGATAGMAMAIYGGGAVNWSRHKDEFPWVTGAVPIFLAWVVSPIACGIAVAILYGLLRWIVLRHDNSLVRAMWTMPPLAGGITWLVTSFIIQTGSKNNTWAPRSDGFVVWVGAVCGAGVAIIAGCMMPWLRVKAIAEAERKREFDIARGRLPGQAGNASVTNLAGEDVPRVGADGLPVAGEGKLATAESSSDGAGDLARGSSLDGKLDGAVEVATPAEPEEEVEKEHFESLKHRPRVRNTLIFLCYNPVSNYLFTGIRYDIHTARDTDERVKGLWDNAEQFDSHTEQLFRYLQIFSAAAMSLAHGSQDVANAMGPLSAVLQLWRTGTLGKNVSVPEWVLAIGGAGIVIGLAIWGYRIMMKIGVCLAAISPSRSLMVETSAVVVLLVASRYGLPVSTTMVVTGGITALGLLERGLAGVNWRALAYILAGWVFTIFLACGVGAGLTAVGVYGPCKQQSIQAWNTVVALNSTGNVMLRQVAATNFQLATPNEAVTVSLVALNASLAREMTPSPNPADVTTTVLDILDEFNLTLAYNPYSRKQGLLAAQMS